MSVDSDLSAESPVSAQVREYAGRTASFSAAAALSYSGCSSCLFSIYVDNEEIASSFSGRDDRLQEEIAQVRRLIERSGADEWKGNGAVVRRFFSQVSRRLSYAVFLRYDGVTAKDFNKNDDIGKMFDGPVRLIDELTLQSATIDTIARSARLQPVNASTSVTSMLVDAGDAIARTFRGRGFAVLLVKQGGVSIAGGKGDALHIANSLISEAPCVQEMMSLVHGSSPILFRSGETNGFPALSSRITGMTANAVRLPGGFDALFLVDLRDTHALGIHNVESYIQSSFLMSLSEGIAFMDRNLSRSRARSLRSVLYSMNAAADTQTLESLFSSEMNRLLGKTERYCILELSRTSDMTGTILKSCLCENANCSAALQSDDIHLEKVARERLPVILYVPAETAQADAKDGIRGTRLQERMKCFIPYAVGNDTLRVLSLEKSLFPGESIGIESFLTPLSSAFLAKSEEILLKQRLSGERNRLAELNRLISNFSSSGLKFDRSVTGAAMLAGSFSSFRVVAYFEKRASMECLSFASSGAASTSIPEIDTLPIELLMRHVDNLTFEIAESESDMVKRDVISSFSEFLQGDEQTCTILCLREGTEPFSLLLVISSEPRTEALVTCELLRPIMANMRMLSSFRRRLSIEREIGFANRNMLDEIGRVNTDADIHTLSADFCRLLLSFSGAAACILYNQSSGENYEFTAAYPEDLTKPTGIIRPDDLGLHGLAQSDGSVIRHITDRDGTYSKRLKVGAEPYVAWDVILIRDSYGGSGSDHLVFLGYSDETATHDAERAALVQLSKAFTKLIQIKLLSFSPDSGPSMDVSFLNLIFSSVRWENDRWEFDDTEVSSRFASLMAKALGMKYAILYRVGENGTVVIEGSSPSLKSLNSDAVNDCIGLISELTAGSAENRSAAVISLDAPDDGGYSSLRSIPVGDVLLVPVPITQNTQRSGFFLFDEKQRGLGYSHTRVASTIADAYATVMDNRANRTKMGWMLNALASELRVVRNISSTFELPVILNYATQEVNTFVSADLTCLFLEDDMGAMNVASISGPPKEIIDEVMRKPSNAARSGEARRSGFALLASDSAGHFYMSDASSAAEALSRMPDEQRYDLGLLNRGTPVKCMLGVPVSFAGKMLGILVCFNTSAENAFKETDIGFIESVAALLATAIENSRNFRTTYDALNKLSKLDTLRSNFSSIAAHELRTPLTSIRVYIELMNMGRVGKFTEPEKKNLENLLASITELNEIISNMLEFTRMEALLLETEMASTSLAPVVDEVCALVSPQLNAKTIELEMDIDRNTRKINANAPLIKRVANNLIGNAIKFTPPGGRISVSLRNEADGVLLTVADTGKGISEEDLPFIFDRYHVVDASILHSGTGFRFGLPITKLIVERHGGKIWAESVLGKGSRFFVFLPSQRSIYKEDWLSEATAYIR